MPPTTISDWTIKLSGALLYFIQKQHRFLLILSLESTTCCFNVTLPMVLHFFKKIYHHPNFRNTIIILLAIKLMVLLVLCLYLYHQGITVHQEIRKELSRIITIKDKAVNSIHTHDQDKLDGQYQHALWLIRYIDEQRSKIAAGSEIDLRQLQEFAKVEDQAYLSSKPIFRSNGAILDMLQLCQNNNLPQSSAINRMIKIEKIDHSDNTQHIKTQLEMVAICINAGNYQLALKILQKTELTCMQEVQKALQERQKIEQILASIYREVLDVK